MIVTDLFKLHTEKLEDPSIKMSKDYTSGFVVYNFFYGDNDPNDLKEDENAQYLISFVEEEKAILPTNTASGLTAEKYLLLITAQAVAQGMSVMKKEIILEERILDVYTNLRIKISGAINGGDYIFYNILRISRMNPQELQSFKLWTTYDPPFQDVCQNLLEDIYNALEIL